MLARQIHLPLPNLVLELAYHTPEHDQHFFSMQIQTNLVIMSPVVSLPFPCSFPGEDAPKLKFSSGKRFYEFLRQPPAFCSYRFPQLY